MIIKCGKCGRTIDLNTQAAILSFLKGMPVKCNCKNEICYEKYEVKENYEKRYKESN